MRRCCKGCCDRSVGRLEARVGIEPTHKGFADLSLTTWVPRLKNHEPRRPRRSTKETCSCTSCTLVYFAVRRLWSGRRELNPRLRPWQGRTLPLSYSRSVSLIISDG